MNNNSMNDKNTQVDKVEERQRGEVIASGIMKVLAIVGLIGVLVLAAWLAVQLVRTVPNAGNRLQGAVVAVQSLFRNAPEEAVALVLENRTVNADEQFTINFEYTGANSPSGYVFSFACADAVTLDIDTTDGWQNVACDTPFTTENASIVVIPRSNSNRFIDIDITVQALGTELSDTTLITIVNERIADSRSSLIDGATTTESGADEPSDNTATSGADSGANNGVAPEAHTPVTTPTPVAPRPSTVVTPVRTPIATGPSDLAVNITKTGVVAPVKGVNVLFPISPIPSDKTAGVTFTVTNQGGAASGAWAFVANLPIEGDSNYKYTSPAQVSLAPGAQVEFTLGFDEVLEASRGTIKIELKPTQATDKTANNIDTVSIQIKN